MKELIKLKSNKRRAIKSMPLIIVAGLVITYLLIFFILFYNDSILSWKQTQRRPLHHRSQSSQVSDETSAFALKLI